MKKITLRTINAALSTLAASALVLMPFAGAVSVASATTAQATTDPATSITSSNATLNGMNGDNPAANSSFWVATSTFSTPEDGTPIPAGVYSTPVLGAQAADAAFSAPLSSATGLPAVTPDTTYYFTAWTEVGDTWSSGAVESFTTISAPTITNIDPASGSTAGGTPITITGTDFNADATVTVGGTAATSIIVASSTSITATTPAGALGPQDVVVTNTDTGTVTSTGGFTYVAAVATSPTTEPATAITSSNATLNGMNGSAAASQSSFWVATSTFSTPTNGTPIPAGVYSTPLLGAQGADAPFSASLSSAVGLPAVTPSTTYYYAAWTQVDGTWSPGAVLQFTTLAATAVTPTVTSVSPTSGTISGGTVVTITGTGFTGATAVDFGGVAATDVTASTTALDTSIMATSPATTTAGVVDVTVTTPEGTSAISDADQFTYEIGGTVTGGVIPGGTLNVTSITPVNTTGEADNTYADGWSYIFDITVPTTEPNLSMEFSDWTGAGTIPAADDMQISSAQAANSSPVEITAANTYSSPALDMIGSTSTSTPGLHVQVLVQVKIPLSTVNGSYTTNYGVQTLP